MKIFTIGHSTRPVDEFMKILKKNKIEYLVDVRSYPSSRLFPQYNKNNLKLSLKKNNIKYKHIEELGGRRHNKSTLDTSIRIRSFSSYAAYMRTKEFLIGLNKLKKIAKKYRTVIMCAEALWYKCHRRMISDRLTYDGWKVYHLGMGKPIIHKIWDIARLNKHNEIIYDA
jgi:uncharacterized protein (DUF488 family)